MKKISFLAILLLLNSCATKKRTLIYSALGGAVLGGFIGRELSPSNDADNLNTAIGGTAGGALGAGIGYLLYKDANPEMSLPKVPIKDEQSLDPLIDNNFGMDKIKITPKIIPLGERQYIPFDKSVPDELRSNAKKQYFKKYRTEAYSFEQDGQTYVVPSFDVIVNGVE